jgi:signal peptidase I
VKRAEARAPLQKMAVANDGPPAKVLTGGGTGNRLYFQPTKFNYATVKPMNSGHRQNNSPYSAACYLRLLLGRHPKRTLVRVLLLIITSVVLFRFILVPVKVIGRSMEPTCYDGQVSLVNMLAYTWKQPQRGDVVAIKIDDKKQVILKRLIGMPGEQIAFHTGVVFINGKRLEEPYLASIGAWEWPEETLGNKTYFVTGDNRSISQQFRVERQQIIGKLFQFRH